MDGGGRFQDFLQPGDGGHQEVPGDVEGLQPGLAGALHYCPAPVLVSLESLISALDNLKRWPGVESLNYLERWGGEGFAICRKVKYFLTYTAMVDYTSDGYYNPTYEKYDYWW